MKRISMALALAFGITAQASAQTPAQLAGHPSVEAAFASQQQTIQSLEARLASLEAGGPIQVGDKGCNSCCNPYGAFAGGELIIAKPYFSDEVDPPNEPSYEDELQYRLYGGYRGANGLGIRARYFDADWTSDAPAGNTVGAPLSLEMDVIDLEMTQIVDLGAMMLDVSGGARYVDASQSNGMGSGHFFEGYGPTIAAEAVVPVGCRPISLVGNVRASYLFGDSAGGAPPVGNEDDFGSIYEAQLGIQYARDTAYGGTLAARVVAEAQSWESILEDPNGFTSGNDEDLGIIGAAFRLEYAR